MSLATQFWCSSQFSGGPRARQVAGTSVGTACEPSTRNCRGSSEENGVSARAARKNDCTEEVGPESHQRRGLWFRGRGLLSRGWEARDRLGGVLCVSWPCIPSAHGICRSAGFKYKGSVNAMSMKATGG